MWKRTTRSPIRSFLLGMDPARNSRFRTKPSVGSSKVHSGDPGLRTPSTKLQRNSSRSPDECRCKILLGEWRHKLVKWDRRPVGPKMKHKIFFNLGEVRLRYTGIGTWLYIDGYRIHKYGQLTVTSATAKIGEAHRRASRGLNGCM